MSNLESSRDHLSILATMSGRLNNDLIGWS
ncbi:hypothetical protein A2U01_0107538, partial [Trifolium medium]|nr:hypothetical protein [Trifolium medium]